jgi:hypothetical protein
VAQLAGECLLLTALFPYGGVLAMRPLLIHSSSKSQSVAPRPRRVLHIEYAESVMTGHGLELAVA